MKHFLRRLAVKFEYLTSSWVVPESVWLKLDDGTLTDSEVSELRKEWPDDPEVIRLQTIKEFTNS